MPDFLHCCFWRVGLGFLCCFIGDGAVASRLLKGFTPVVLRCERTDLEEKGISSLHVNKMHWREKNPHLS